MTLPACLQRTVAILACLSPFATAQSEATDGTPIRLPRDPAISPDGRSLAFAWQGDLWTADSGGGAARRLTYHSADDSAPHYSPDGEHIYFESGRSGRTQIHVMPAAGGPARQITHDSIGKDLLEVSADGKHLLILRVSDRSWHWSESDRVYTLDVSGEEPARMLFDAGAVDATLSPDGTKVLFVRGRSAWSRKGYVGPQAAQLWLADLSTAPVTLTRLDSDREGFQNVAAMDPVWAADSKTFFFNSDPQGTFELHRSELPEAGAEPAIEQLTRVGADGSDDGVCFPALSRDGDTFVFRRRFDLVTADAATGKLRPISLYATGDDVTAAVQRPREDRADRVAFTPDGKQMAFVAGQDVWVMDRILKEPVRVTHTPEDETSLVFNADGTRLYFVSDSGGEVDIWEATHEQEDGIWWMATEFHLRQVTDDRPVEGDLLRSPNGSHIAYSKGTDLWVMDDDGSDARQVVSTWSGASFDWAPDGSWMAYETQDDDYNPDVYLVPLDGTSEPFNLSRHPDRDGAPTWSSDGKRIAWVGRRDGEEADIYWVDLAKGTGEMTARDETLEKALKAMQGKDDKKKGKGRSAAGEGADSAEAEEDGGPAKGAQAKDDGEIKVTIDFDGLLDRVQRIRIPDTFESGLIWLNGGKTLAFQAEIDGKRGLYSVEFPRPGAPQLLASGSLSNVQWFQESKQFVGLSSGTPATMDAKGKIERFDFEVRTELDWRRLRQIAFDQGWRAMRDRFYDEAYNNRDWYEIRAKYRPIAAQCLGAREFSDLMNLMLGELNASHMGHRGGRDPLPRMDPGETWTPSTYHTGLRLRSEGASGLLVESVIPGSPCSQERSHVKAGETLVSIDGTAVGPGVDIDALMTMDSVRDVLLIVRSAAGEEREVTVRPVRSVAGLLYPEWVETTRKQVETLSKGKLGYLHIRGMNFPSFRQMEEDLYHAGAGKDGLLIDVRFNGGGSTTDHVMTALTQPVHAITQSRGSGLGYPQDRKIYASWSKPIVLLCNEHSFSNAEILSHAIQQIGRGRLVGMRTAGGVISTGSVRLLDGGSVRMPMRGWYLAKDGADMELNGCQPDICFWNAPDWTGGSGDAQLSKAVETLLEDVAAEQAKGSIEPVPASALRR